MQIDTAMLGIIITVLLAILGLAVAWGALGQKVRGHDKELTLQHNENREDHRQIFCKLEEISTSIRNGGGQKHS